MKTSKKIILVCGGCVLAVLATGIASVNVLEAIASDDENNATYFNNSNQDQKITGNGKIVNKSITTTDFTTLNTTGIYNLTINTGNENNVNVATDENIIPYLVIDNKKDALTIRTKKGIIANVSQLGKIVVTAAKPLQQINLGGYITWQANNINSDKLELATGGKNVGYLQGDIKNLQMNLGGDSEMHVTVNDSNVINLNIGGKGTIELSGKVKDLTITTGGQATVLAKNLIAENVTIRGAGESNMTLNVGKTLSVVSIGESNIKYYGNPTINKSSLGDVNITKATN